MATLQDLFEQAADLPEAEQRAFLARIGSENPALQFSLEQLLRADRKLAHTTMKPATAGIAQWAAALTGTSLRPGDVVGSFRILAPLGQGGMGVVFHAERVEGGVTQQVALKLVRQEHLDQLARRRFELERQALASLDHPYIARLLDAAELPDGTPYFVMEFVDGVPITTYCEERKLSVRQRIELFRRVCQAVAHAHQHLLVHRDLKPGNILVGQDGLPKLLDFGIAKPLGGSLSEAWSLQTGTAQRYFSPKYAAPEQLRGDAIQIGCDVYALGVLLFELLTNNQPFEFDNLSMGQVEQLVTQMPAPLPSSRVNASGAEKRQRVRVLQGDLDGIIQKCLRKAPAERYESVVQLDEDLERWQQGMPVLARHGHRWYRFSKFVSRHRIAVSTAAASVLALTIAAAALWNQNQALSLERDRASEALAIMQEAFLAADPIRAAGAEVSARQILDSAERRLDQIAPDQQGLLATLAESIGRVNLSLGRPKVAAVLFVRAGRAAEASGATVEQRTRILVAEARARLNNDDREGAQAALDGAKTLMSEPGPEWLVLQGKLRVLRDNDRAGLAEMRAAMEVLLQRGPTDEFATTSMFSLADALVVLSENEEAIKVIDQTLHWQQAGLPKDHPLILRTRLRKMALLSRIGDNSAALAQAGPIVADVQRVFGPGSTESALAHNAHGQALEAVGQVQEALAAFRQSLEASVKALGFDHINTNRSQFNLAYTLQMAGGFDAEAERHFRDVVASTNRRLGPNHESSVYFRMHFAKFLASRNRSREAFELMTPEDGQQGLLNSSPPNRLEYLNTLTALPDYQECRPDEQISDACQRAQAWVAGFSASVGKGD